MINKEEVIETTQKCLNDDCDGCDFRKFEFCRRELLKNLFCVAKQQQAELEKQRIMLEAIEDAVNPLPFETDYDKSIRQAKSEAIKEFAERLKEKADYYENGQGWEGDIYYADDVENLVKEMVGDD